MPFTKFPAQFDLNVTYDAESEVFTFLEFLGREEVHVAADVLQSALERARESEED